MSCTTMLRVWPGEKYEQADELRNAWGSAPVIWNEMAQHWLGLGPHAFMGRGDEIWPLWRRKDIPLHQRAVLAMTFDRAYVARDNFTGAAADIRAFLKDYPPVDGQANHWPRIAEIFEQEKVAPAMGFHMTSVSDNPFDGPWNEEAERYDPIDWDTAFEVYAALSENND